MKLCSVSITLILLCFLIRINVGIISDVSINCGSTGTSSAQNGRKWIGDAQQRISPLLQLKGSSTTSTAIPKLTSAADPVPYKTARVSRSQFSYAFRVNPGQKIIRLHFNPTAYKGFKGLIGLFTVEAGPFTLLSNFSSDALRVNSLTREFCLNILEIQLLNITFSAETSQSRDAYAFINGIEIISVPASHSYFQGGRDIGLLVVGQKTLVSVDDSIALEMIYRLNIKQDLASSSADDSDDLFGMWVTAPPQEASSSSNVTWKISVDVGFRYLVRLHFSKPGLKMAETGGMNFKVFINDMIASTNNGIVVKERDGSSFPWYGDYMVMMNGRKQEGKRDLLIRLQSNEEIMDGPLKGFEVLKLSNPDNSLASPIAMPPSQDSTSKTIQILRKVEFCMIILSIIVYKSREIWGDSSSEEGNKPSARAERLCRRFSLSVMRSATSNFNDGHLIGRGGFGKVYKGVIDKEQKIVAVKRLKSKSEQGEHEFLTEIETLSQLRHNNIVSLIGFCCERKEMILVYEYMACGTLADHLYKLARENSNCSSLKWKQRLNISIGAARGLDYLHTGNGIIHRDVNSSNILLDDNFVAKVSDFGLAKPEDRTRSQSYVSTKVKGTRGYLDPYYCTTQKLTRKCDTYALGVVLLEVLCGRPAVDYGVSEDEKLLVMWAREKIRKGEVDQIVASCLRDEISPNSLKTFVEITERCLDDEPKSRPTMSQVLMQLEFALDQQDSNQNSELNGIAAEIHPSNGACTVQPTVGPINMQNLTLPAANQQTNKKVVSSNLVSGRNHKGKTIRNKLWSLVANRRRVKPSKKCYNLSLSEINLPKFDWNQISAATNHFSASNIVRFPGNCRLIYKAVLPSGEIVAVKRRSSSSAAEGQEEFKNEINVLPNLQHRNVIKLLGYCIDGEELLLVHEFVEYTIRDYLMDKGNQQRLPWAVRFQIIMGIARGLVYLHQESGLRVIHRDLKSSNILLDLKMNPKLSDFDLARSMAEYQSEQETSTIEDAHGNLSPDSHMHREFPVKLDVHNFGIILLEIVSGRKAFDINLENGSLAEHAWKLWNEGRAIDLVDDSLGSAFLEDEAIRCIQVALLCIQEDPHHHSSMPSVIKMLEGNEGLIQPQPTIEVDPLEFSA